MADIHGKYKPMNRLLDGIKEEFDLILCPGDFTDMFDIPERFSQMDIANLVLQGLLSENKPLLCVPGNHDPYEIIGLFQEYEVNLQERVRDFQEIQFMGIGGAETPFNTNIEPTEEELKAELEKLGSKVDVDFVLVTHNPPQNTKLDKTSSGKHVGSEAIRKFIEENHPLVAVSAHIHEAGGTDTLGNTKLIYPGMASKGNYGIIEIEGKDVRCEIKKVKV